MKKFFWLLLIFGFSMYSQCFNCNKNVGGWTHDYAMDIERTTDGLVYLVTSNGFTAGYINKYDFDCNLIWSKTFGYDNIRLHSVTSDEDGYIYLIVENTSSTNAGMGPWNISGFMMSPGINFYKLTPQGDIVWTRHIGPRIGPRIQNIVFSQNMLYITGTFYDNLTFSPSVSYSHPYTDYPRAFIAKYDTDGNFLDATEHGNGNESFTLSEVDTLGNIYFTYHSPSYESSKVCKFSADLNLVWTISLTSSGSGNSTPGKYCPSAIKFNSDNQKLYIWGGISETVNILGHTFFVSTNNGVFQSVLTEFNTSNGTLTNIKRFDNNSNYSVPALNGTHMERTAFMREKDGDLYVLTSFRNNMIFPNGVATSSASGTDWYSEDLVLFKMKLADFMPEFILQSHGVLNPGYYVADRPGNIVFNEDDLYLTASFGSKPLNINGSLINNNSGNSNSDGMLYKLTISDMPGAGSIIPQNTCVGDLTAFTLDGEYDSVVWNFGEPDSPNNVSTAPNPQHQYLSVGTYTVTATVTCGANTQTIEKEITITAIPYLNTIPPLTACEDSFGSGISSSFDITQLKNMLVGSQADVSLAFFTSDGAALQGPLPNPFTNTDPFSQTLTVRAFFHQNPTCYAEGSISFNTVSSSLAPTASSPQVFCVQLNAVIDDIATTENNVIWHDAPSAGNILAGGTSLVDGTTYYASLMNGDCESPRTAVTISIQSTPAPAGSANQLFCASSNPSLANVTVIGDDVKWYNAIGGLELPPSTILTDGATYYVTQTINGCESINLLEVTVQVQSALDAEDVYHVYCDENNDGFEMIDLNMILYQVIENAEQYSFSLFTSLNAAQQGIDIISNLYELPIGNSVVFARVTSAGGCFAIVQLVLGLIESPQIAIPDALALCKNVENIVIHAGNFSSYLWSTGAVSSSISVALPGTYWVTVTENHNGLICTGTKNFDVFVSDAPAFIDVQISEWTFDNNSILVQVDVQGVFEYSLDGINFQSSNIFNDLPPGKYTVYVRDVYRCGITMAEVVLLMHPRFFTPNGDGFNDDWAVHFSELENDLHTSIYDRYGKRIHQMSNNQRWDGKFNGEDLPASDYWFVVNRSNGKEYRGHFTLKR